MAATAASTARVAEAKARAAEAEARAAASEAREAEAAATATTAAARAAERQAAEAAAAAEDNVAALRCECDKLRADVEECGEARDVALKHSARVEEELCVRSSKLQIAVCDAEKRAEDASMETRALQAKVDALSALNMTLSDPEDGACAHPTRAEAELEEAMAREVAVAQAVAQAVVEGESELRKVRGQLQAAASERDDARHDVKRLSERLAATVSRVDSELALASAASRRHHVELRCVGLEVQQAEADAKAARADKADARVALSTSNDLVAQYKAENRRLRGALRQARQLSGGGLEEDDDELAAMAEETQTAQELVHALQVADAAGAERDRLRDELTTAQEDVDGAYELTMRLRGTIAQAEARALAAEGESARLRAEGEELRMTLGAARTDGNTLEAALAASEQATKEQAEAAEEVLATVRAELAHVSGLAEARLECEATLRKQIKSLKDDVEAQKGQTKEAQGEVERVVGELRRRSGKLSGELMQAMEAGAQRRTESLHLRKTLNAVEAELAEVRAELKRTVDQLACTRSAGEVTTAEADASTLAWQAAAEERDAAKSVIETLTSSYEAANERAEVAEAALSNAQREYEVECEAHARCAEAVEAAQQAAGVAALERQEMRLACEKMSAEIDALRTSGGGLTIQSTHLGTPARGGGSKLVHLSTPMHARPDGDSPLAASASSAAGGEVGEAGGGEVASGASTSESAKLGEYTAVNEVLAEAQEALRRMSEECARQAAEAQSHESRANILAAQFRRYVELTEEELSRARAAAPAKGQSEAPEPLPEGREALVESRDSPVSSSGEAEVAEGALLGMPPASAPPRPPRAKPLVMVAIEI